MNEMTNSHILVQEFEYWEPESLEEAISLLNECGDNLPLVDSSYVDLAERIRFAVLKLSRGNYERLVEAAREAAIDWRDTLVAADFANDTKAHLAWEFPSSRPSLNLAT